MKTINAIHLGLRRGYYDYKQLIDSPIGVESKMTEYLLTVAVAKELISAPLKVNPKQIFVEYPLWEFYTNAFPKIKQLNKNAFFDQPQFTRRVYKKPRTKQRLDIAVIGKDDDWNERSYCALELKAINTNYNGIINDLQRLSDSMITTDLSDANSIELCFFGCIKSYKNNNTPMTNREISENRKSTLYAIETLIENNFRKNNNYINLTYTIYHKEINSHSSEDYLASCSAILDSNPDFNEAIEETGEAIGIIIEIKKI